MAEEKSFHLAIGSRFENIELVQIVLKDSLERLGLDEDTLYWVDIAVREAVANAIKHGNRQDPAKRVYLSLAGGAEAIEIVVGDEGQGFEATAVADPLAPENQMKTSGRGIFYMKTFMDEVRFERAEGGGMEIFLTKNLASGTEKEEKGS